MKISIVTPSYNQAKYLQATIDSVRGQRDGNYEHIVIDGGSNDGSVDILRANDSILHYWCSERDEGQTDAINKGLDKATGDIIGWINSDDIYLPKTFRFIRETFMRNPTIDVIHGNRLMIDAESNVVGWTCYPPFNHLITGYNICSETTFWRTRSFPGIKLRKELRFAMDVELFTRMYAGGAKFYKTSRILGAFRCYPENKSSTIAHVGDSEGRKIWKERFGTEVPVREDIGGGGKMEQAWHALINPRCLLIPYIHYRLRKALRGQKRGKNT